MSSHLFVHANISSFMLLLEHQTARLQESWQKRKWELQGSPRIHTYLKNELCTYFVTHLVLLKVRGEKKKKNHVAGSVWGFEGMNNTNLHLHMDVNNIQRSIWKYILLCCALQSAILYILPCIQCVHCYMTECLHSNLSQNGCVDSWLHCTETLTCLNHVCKACMD